jgi:hypothetical protein
MIPDASVFLIGALVLALPFFIDALRLAARDCEIREPGSDQADATGRGESTRRPRAIS